MRWWIALAMGLASTGLWACDDDDGGGGPIQMEPDVPMRRGDAALDGGPTDAGPRPDRGPQADTGGGSDAAADAGLIRDIEDCAGICGVYETCGRLPDLWADDAAQCMSACADATENMRFRSYLACMQVTDCDRLQECAVPPKPQPTCAEVCAAADACEADFRLPGALNGVADCASACDDATIGQRIRSCGESVVDGACDEVDFARCLIEALDPQCLAICDNSAPCDEDLDVVDCAIACTQPPASEDPVFLRRRTQRRQCLTDANDCEAVAACDALGVRPIVGDATVAEMCAANAECQFLSVESCEAEAEDLLRTLADGAVDCFTDHFTERCAEPPYACFNPAPAPEGGCTEHCLVSDICGLLPEGQTEFECTEACLTAQTSGDPAQLAPFAPLFRCAAGGSCDEVAACQANADADAVCTRICAREAECEVEGSDGCADRCAAAFDTARVRAERACVDAAATCDGVTRCVPPPAPDCATLCAPLVACGADEADCRRACDDRDFVDPAAFLPHLACVTAAGRCDAREACAEDPSGGAACLSWCRLQAECAPEADVLACVQTCGAGLAGQDGLTFDGAADCLAAAAPDAACGDLQACVDAVAADAHCAGYCAELGRCRLDDDPDACLAACADPGVPVEDAACVLNAVRRGDGCAPVADCIGAEVEPASPACQALCGARHTCDEDVDTFLCERDCIPEPAEAPVQAACAGRATCEELPMCLEAAADVPAPCGTACDAVEACDGLIGEGDGALYAARAACDVDCAGAAVLRDETYPMAVSDCVGGALCDGEAVAACFADPSNECAEAWEALVGCGFDGFIGGGEPMWNMDCNNNLANDPAGTRAALMCIIDTAAMAMGDPLACFGLAACLL